MKRILAILKRRQVKQKGTEGISPEVREIVAAAKAKINRTFPTLLSFSLVVLNEKGEKVDDFYLGTRGHNEPEALFLCMAYDLLESVEREVSLEEAMGIWSKWLNRPAGIIPWIVGDQYERWTRWTMRQDLDPIAVERFASYPNTYTFRVIQKDVGADFSA